MRDMVNNLDVVSSIDPDDYTADVDGAGVDLQGFEGVVVSFIVGTLTDGTHTPKVEESDTGAFGGEENDVAAADLDGTLAALASDTNQRVGYKGSKQHIRSVLTVTGGPATGVQAASVIIRGHAHRAPVA